MRERGVWKRLGRMARVVATWTAIVIALVLIAAATYEHVGGWRDGRVLRQIGRSVDIGGRSLNIHCVGDGRPTVVFVSGRTAPGYVWTPTQRGVAAFTRACWYDRADLGWSDSGPDPAWGDQAARDLHRLVQQAPLPRPLVLVGHSFGGYVIRLYHHAYPGEVSGMVFVDTALEDANRIRADAASRSAERPTFDDPGPLDVLRPPRDDAPARKRSRPAARGLDRRGVGHPGAAPAPKEPRRRRCASRTGERHGRSSARGAWHADGGAGSHRSRCRGTRGVPTSGADSVVSARCFG